MTRTIFYGVSVLLVVWAGLVVPMPRVEFSPGDAFPVEPLVEITTDVATTPINGELELLTVRVDQPSVVESVRAWLSPTRELRPVGVVIPTGINQREYRLLQQRIFQRSFHVAVAVGLRLAGQEVAVRTAPVVEFAVPGGPAAAVLRPGDVILEVDGTTVTAAEELIALGRGFEEGEPVELTVLRHDERMTVELVPAMLPQIGRPGLGVQLSTIAYDVALPFAVELAPTRIGGPSAGLMVAVTVYDLLVEEDLAAGRSIAGTGTVDEEGRIGAIGGISQKVVGAERAGADLLLVPAAQAEEALAAAEGRSIEVYPVATVSDAIEVLRRTAATAG